jgi:hypothetical protein
MAVHLQNVQEICIKVEQWTTSWRRHHIGENRIKMFELVLELQVLVSYIQVFYISSMGYVPL